MILLSQYSYSNTMETVRLFLTELLKPAPPRFSTSKNVYNYSYLDLYIYTSACNLNSCQLPVWTLESCSPSYSRSNMLHAQDNCIYTRESVTRLITNCFMGGGKSVITSLIFLFVFTHCTTGEAMSHRYGCLCNARTYKI